MNDTAELFIDSRCELGEGPFWHPLQERLFWFDILNKTLFSATAGGIMVDRFTFDATVTAAGVIDADHLAIASSAGIFKLQISTDTRELISALEPDSTAVRTNDGRVNPAGGLWIGTMGLNNPSKVAAGALYQVRAGQVTKLRSDVYIPNANCFSPDGRTAYFADTPTGVIQQVSIDPETGLPNGEWREFVRVDGPGQPDGAVVDSEGFIWNAQWNGSRVVRYSPSGKVDRIVKLPVSKTTCPAFGGKDLKTLYITSAREGMSPDELAAEPNAGSVFAIEVDVPGLPENLFRA
ncbi:MAG: SMP-30/gluconolactonase/LRE family protein [Devosia sp.]